MPLTGLFVYIKCAKNNNLTRRPFSRRPTARLCGEAQGNKCEYVHMSHVGGDGGGLAG